MSATDSNKDYVLKHAEDKWFSFVHEYKRYKRGELPLDYLYTLLKTDIRVIQSMIEQAEGDD